MSDIKVITNLSGKVATKNWNFTAGRITPELDYSIPGVVRGTQHSKEGLLFYRGKDNFIGIPMDELWKLIEETEPKFKEPRAPVTAKAKQQPAK